jgi:hypothetical protein
MDDQNKGGGRILTMLWGCGDKIREILYGETGDEEVGEDLEGNLGDVKWVAAAMTMEVEG